MTRSKSRNSQRVIRYANRAQKSPEMHSCQIYAKGCMTPMNNNSMLPCGQLNNLLKEVKPGNEWMTRNMLNKAFMKHQHQQKTCDDVPTVVGVKKSNSILSELSNVSSNAAIKGPEAIGQPIRTTEAKKKNDENTLISAKNEIAQKYAALKGKAAQKGERVKPGTLKDVIKTFKSTRGVSTDISPDVNRGHIHQKKLTSHRIAGGQVNPLMRIEPVVVEIILQMTRIRQCLCPGKGLDLVNSPIKGTRYRRNLCNGKGKIIQMILGP